MKEGDRVSLFRSFQILFWCWGLIEPSIYPDKNYLRAKLVSYDLSSGSDIGLIWICIIPKIVQITRFEELVSHSTWKTPSGIWKY